MNEDDYQWLREAGVRLAKGGLRALGRASLATVDSLLEDAEEPISFVRKMIDSKLQEPVREVDERVKKARTRIAGMRKDKKNGHGQSDR